MKHVRITPTSNNEADSPRYPTARFRDRRLIGAAFQAGDGFLLHAQKLGHLDLGEDVGAGQIPATAFWLGPPRIVAYSKP